MQGVTMDFMLGGGYLPGGREEYVGPGFAVATSVSGGKTSVVVMKTVMYPGDMNVCDPDFCRLCAEVLLRGGETDPGDCDVYFLGSGLVRKDVPEEEKGVFVPGQKYGLAINRLRRVARRAGEDFGFLPEKPVPAGSIPGEYALIEKLAPGSGKIVSAVRLGSTQGEEHILDEWRIEVLRDNGLIVVSDIYLDPYAAPETPPRLPDLGDLFG